MNRTFERWLPWLLVALAIPVWLVALNVGPLSERTITDIPVYQDAWRAIADGGIPYRDFNLEYPPLAAALFWLAGALPMPYAVAFATLMFACLAACIVAVVRMAQVMDTTPLRRIGAGVAVALAPVLLGSVLGTRYDLALAAALAWMLWAALTERFRLMWTLLAVAVLIKLVPLALIPILVIWQRHHRGLGVAVKGAAASLAAVVVVFAPFVMLSPSGTWRLFSYHLDRPLQLESVGASYLLGLHALADIPLHIEHSFGSQGLGGRGPAVIAGIATAALLGLLAAIAISLSIGLRRARPPGDARLFMAASCASVVALLVGGKVLSPQFMIWLLPVAFLVTGRYGRATFALAIGAMLLTVLYFPYLYWDLVALDPWAIAILVARDACLIGLLAACWPRPSIARRPRGWMFDSGRPAGERAIPARYLID